MTPYKLQKSEITPRAKRSFASLALRDDEGIAFADDGACTDRWSAILHKFGYRHARDREQHTTTLNQFRLWV